MTDLLEPFKYLSFSTMMFSCSCNHYTCPEWQRQLGLFEKEELMSWLEECWKGTSNWRALFGVVGLMTPGVSGGFHAQKWHTCCGLKARSTHPLSGGLWVSDSLQETTTREKERSECVCEHAEQGLHLHRPAFIFARVWVKPALSLVYRNAFTLKTRVEKSDKSTLYNITYIPYTLATWYSFQTLSLK